MSLEENLRNKTLFLVRIQVMYEDISNNSIIYITQLFYLITFLIFIMMIYIYISENYPQNVINPFLFHLFTSMIQKVVASSVDNYECSTRRLIQIARPGIRLSEVPPVLSRKLLLQRFSFISKTDLKHKVIRRTCVCKSVSK